MLSTVRSLITDKRTAQLLPKFDFSDNRYRVAIAISHEQVDEALKLRFNVFNLELGEGLQSSFSTLRDMDEFDTQCHHILVEEICTGRIIGTYRIQTYEMAMRGIGFYSSGEFKVNMLGPGILKKSIELGRACIDKNHRNGRVLFLLWQGIARYMTLFNKRYLFGCCSLTSQNPEEGKSLMIKLEDNNYLSGNHYVLPKKDFECYEPDFELNNPLDIEIPLLMKLYLKYGAKVCGPPAIDREFKTIDYFVILDQRRLSQEIYSMFF